MIVFKDYIPNGLPFILPVPRVAISHKAKTVSCAHGKEFGYESEYVILQHISQNHVIM